MSGPEVDLFAKRFQAICLEVAGNRRPLHLTGFVVEVCAWAVGSSKATVGEVCAQRSS